jgi:hypothetical protein
MYYFGQFGWRVESAKTDQEMKYGLNDKRTTCYEFGSKDAVGFAT